jgi:hypothetical protein
MTLLLALLACESAPALVSRPTEVRLERFCRDETPSTDGVDITKSYIKEILLKDGWTYEGPLHNDGINCTVSLWTR